MSTLISKENLEELCAGVDFDYDPFASVKKTEATSKSKARKKGNGDVKIDGSENIT